MYPIMHRSAVNQTIVIFNSNADWSIRITWHTWSRVGYHAEKEKVFYIFYFDFTLGPSEGELSKMKTLHWASLTGKRRSSVLLVWLCERTFFHLIMNKQPMLKLLMVDVYLIVVSKPLNIPGWGGWGGGCDSYTNVHLRLKCISL